MTREITVHRSELFSISLKHYIYILKGDYDVICEHRRPNSFCTSVQSNWGLFFISIYSAISIDCMGGH